MLTTKTLLLRHSIAIKCVALCLFVFYATSAALAQTSGVLLGLASAQDMRQDHDNSGSPKYRTLWIGEDPSGYLKVLSVLEELVVPRRDGFWHAGVKEVCEFANADEEVLQIAWAAPVGQAGVVEQAHPSCTPHKPEDYASPLQRSEENGDKISQCGFQRTRIEYLSPELMSISNYSGESEECEPRGGHYSQTYYVRRFETDQPIGFGKLLGEKALDAYKDSVQAHSANDMGEENCGSGADEDDDTGWRILHESGSWKPYLNQSLGMFGCSVEALIHFPLPIALTGEPARVSLWKLLKAKMPNIEDVYSSPSGDLLIGVSKGQLKFYAGVKGTPGDLLLTLPAERIVMAQWASGKHVQEWTAEIARLARQSPIPPVVTIKDRPR